MRLLVGLFIFVSAAPAQLTRGDALVVGVPVGFNTLFQSIPLPSSTNQKFCDLVQIAPSTFVEAYVPTAAERQGDFSAFSGLLRDPANGNAPFPGGIIPASRLGSIHAWRIASPPGGAGPTCINFPGGRVAFSSIFYTSGLIGGSPSLVYSPTTLGYVYYPSPFFPFTQAIALGSTGTSVNFSASRVITSPPGGAWLSISVSSSSTPALINVTVNPNNLAAGTYRGAVNIFAGSESAIVIPVTLTQTVGAPPPPVIVPKVVPFSFKVNGAPQTLSVSISSPNNARLGFSTGIQSLAGRNWLTLGEGSSGTTPATLRFIANPAGLGPGTYLSKVVYTGLALDGTPFTGTSIARMSVGGNSALAVNPKELTFDGATPGPQNVDVTALPPLTGPLAQLNFQSEIVYQEPPDGAWLTAAPLNSATPRPIAASVNPTQPPVSPYSSYIQFSGFTPGGVPFGEVVSAVWAGAIGGPVVSLESSLISATLPAGATPVSQDIAVSSTNAALAYTTSITGNPPWLAVTPSGTTPSSMRVTLNPAGLAPGDYASSIIVNANGSVNPPQTVSVNLTVVREETNVRQVLAQIADGAGWRTAITLVNTDNVSPHAFTLRFYPGVSTPSTRRLALAAPDTLVDSALTLRTIPAGGSVTIQTAGVDTDVWTGWAELIAPAAIGGTAIFRRQISFNQDGEGAVPIKPVSVNRFLLPFDNTQSFVTSMALVNTSSQDGSITVRFRDETGTTITVDEPTTFPLRARGHDAFELPRRFVRLAGRRGVAEFSSSTGELAALGLRFNDQPIARTFASFETLDPTVTAGSLTITHIADGGGWKTTMQLVNTGAGTARFTLRFFPGRNSPPGAPLRIEGRTLSNDLALPEIAIQPGGSIVLDTLGADAGQPWQGWGQITVNAGQIGGVAVFRQSAPGFPYQEGSVPIVAGGTSRFLLPFDNLAGFASTMAIVNATPSAADSVSVLLRFETGQAIPVPAGQATSVTLNPRGHDAFILASRFARAGNVRGVAEFLSPAGQVFGLGLRCNDARRGFTSLPILRP